MRKTAEPVTVSESLYEGDSSTRTMHPAFAQIRSSNISGHASLYGSDFVHNHYREITIERSSIRRGLSNDRYHGEGEVVSVALSEAQWAAFVSGSDIGSGTPCTITTPGTPSIPNPVDRTRQFSGEVARECKELLAELKTFEAEIQSMNLPKGKAATIVSMLHSVRNTLKSSLPFIAEQFSEHMETTTEKAKSEIHGYMMGVITRAGMLATQKPLELTDGN